MKYDVIIIRYGELSLKSTYVRKLFETTLIKNIQNACKRMQLSCPITKERGRIYLKHQNKHQKQITNILSHIFGITSFSPAVTIHNINNLQQETVQYATQVLSSQKSFALRVRRTGNHTFTSQDIAINVGKAVQQATKSSVDLTNPDIEIYLEIRHNKAYLFPKKIQGVGGLPIGTQGSLLVPINEPNSIIAAWFLMHRGCFPIFITTKPYITMIKQFLKNWFIKTQIQEISHRDFNNFSTFNEFGKQHNCNAIVTPHHISKHDDKTLKELFNLKQQSSFPLLHPLIALNKQIIDSYRKQLGVQT